MRIMAIGILCGGVVLFPSVASAQSGRSGAADARAPAAGNVQAKTPAGTAGKATTRLTEGECKELGGEVYATQVAGVCLSGSFCRTMGEDKKAHYVCISKAK